MDHLLYKICEGLASTALLPLRFTAEKVLAPGLYNDVFGSPPLGSEDWAHATEPDPPPTQSKIPWSPDFVTRKHRPPRPPAPVGFPLRDLVRDVLRSFERMFDKLVSCFGLFPFVHRVLTRVYQGCATLATRTSDINALAAFRISELMARDRKLLEYYQTDIANLKEELQLLRDKE